MLAASAAAAQVQQHRALQAISDSVIEIHGKGSISSVEFDRVSDGEGCVEATAAAAVDVVNGRPSSIFIAGEDDDAKCKLFDEAVCGAIIRSLVRSNNNGVRLSLTLIGAGQEDEIIVDAASSDNDTVNDNSAPVRLKDDWAGNGCTHIEGAAEPPMRSLLDVQSALASAWALHSAFSADSGRWHLAATITSGGSPNHASSSGSSNAANAGAAASSIRRMTVVCIARASASSSAGGKALSGPQPIPQWVRALSGVLTAIETRAPRIPFSSSVLTQLLRPALTGACAAVFVAVAPSSNHSLGASTLQFAARVRSAARALSSALKAASAASVPSAPPAAVQSVTKVEGTNNIVAAASAVDDGDVSARSSGGNSGIRPHATLPALPASRATFSGDSATSYDEHNRDSTVSRIDDATEDSTVSRIDDATEAESEEEASSSSRIDPLSRRRDEAPAPISASVAPESSLVESAYLRALQAFPLVSVPAPAPQDRPSSSSVASSYRSLRQPPPAPPVVVQTRTADANGDSGRPANEGSERDRCASFAEVEGGGSGTGGVGERRPSFSRPSRSAPQRPSAAGPAAAAVGASRAAASDTIAEALPMRERDKPVRPAASSMAASNIAVHPPPPTAVTASLLGSIGASSGSSRRGSPAKQPHLIQQQKARSVSPLARRREVAASVSSPFVRASTVPSSASSSSSPAGYPQPQHGLPVYQRLSTADNAAADGAVDVSSIGAVPTLRQTEADHVAAAVAAALASVGEIAAVLTSAASNGGEALSSSTSSAAPSTTPSTIAIAPASRGLLRPSDLPAMLEASANERPQSVTATTVSASAPAKTGSNSSSGYSAKRAASSPPKRASAPSSTNQAKNQPSASAAADLTTTIGVKEAASSPSSAAPPASASSSSAGSPDLPPNESFDSAMAALNASLISPRARRRAAAAGAVSPGRQNVGGASALNASYVSASTAARDAAVAGGARGGLTCLMGHEVEIAALQRMIAQLRMDLMKAVAQATAAANEAGEAKEVAAAGKKVEVALRKQLKEQEVYRSVVEDTLRKLQAEVAKLTSDRDEALKREKTAATLLAKEHTAAAQARRRVAELEGTISELTSQLGQARARVTSSQHLGAALVASRAHESNAEAALTQLREDAAAEIASLRSALAAERQATESERARADGLALELARLRAHTAAAGSAAPAEISAASNRFRRGSLAEHAEVDGINSAAIAPSEDPFEAAASRQQLLTSGRKAPPPSGLASAAAAAGSPLTSPSKRTSYLSRLAQMADVSANGRQQAVAPPFSSSPSAAHQTTVRSASRERRPVGAGNAAAAVVASPSPASASSSQRVIMSSSMRAVTPRSAFPAATVAMTKPPLPQHQQQPNGAANVHGDTRSGGGSRQRSSSLVAYSRPPAVSRTL